MLVSSTYMDTYKGIFQTTRKIINIDQKEKCSKTGTLWEWEINWETGLSVVLSLINQNRAGEGLLIHLCLGLQNRQD